MQHLHDLERRVLLSEREIGLVGHRIYKLHDGGRAGLDVRAHLARRGAAREEKARDRRRGRARDDRNGALVDGPWPARHLAHETDRVGTKRDREFHLGDRLNAAHFDFRAP